jgi:hypothetical protein
VGVRGLVWLVGLLAISFASNAGASGVIYCGLVGDKPACIAALRFPTPTEAEAAAHELCTKWGISCTKKYSIDKQCWSIAYTPTSPPRTFGAISGSSSKQATDVALLTCRASQGVPTCDPVYTFCETSSDPADARSDTPDLLGPYDAVTKALPVFIRSVPNAFSSSHPPSALPTLRPTNFFDFGAIRTGISFGIGIIIALLAYAKRAPLINFLIHDRLPYKLPVYGQGIQVLFKRTQRVNWYGRAVFGIEVNLFMTLDQLISVRKYWLGRVIAFDSLRRQRKNQLAQMHFQQAGQLVIPKFKKLPWIIAAFLTIIVPVFVAAYYLLRALISLFLGFLFIRVNISRLVRGTKIESTNLTTLMQAKEAIEENAVYLKEYLELANTFDGRDEAYEPQ